MMGICIAERIEWLPATFADGVRIGRMDGRVVVEWPGIGRLLSSPSGNDAEFFAVDGLDDVRLHKFRMTGLIACRRYLAGGLSLHGSAIGFPRGAVALVGDCGAGKSTTAMALVERYGGKFVADDVVPIDWHGAIPLASPVDDSFWLTPSASEWFGLQAPSAEKGAYEPRMRSAVPERLQAIVHLTYNEAVEAADIQPVAGQDVFSLLSGAQVCFSTGEDDDSLRNFAARARLASSTHVFRLRRRRTLEALEMAAQLLAERFGGSCSTADAPPAYSLETHLSQ